MIKPGLEVPWHIRKYGIRPSHKEAYQHVICIGADIETNEETGEPEFLILCDGKNSRVYEVTKDTVLKVFVDVLRRYICSRSKVDKGRSRNKVVIGFHNLRFDLVALLLGKKENFLYSRFCVEYDDAELLIYAGKTIWGKIKIGRNTALIIDTFRFFSASLKKVAADLKLPHQKMDYVDRKNHPGLFLQYAENDGWVQWDLMEYIRKLHESYNIRFTIGTPSFAQRVFRRNFVKRSIPYPPEEVARMAILSYHGGKSQCYANPGFYRHVYDADIVSCYCWAMTQLPSPYGAWVSTDDIISPWGFYEISGEVGAPPFPTLWTHDFKPLRAGESFNNLCVSGPEAYYLRNTFKAFHVKGWIFIPEREDNPLRDYANHFYALKERTPKTDVNYPFIKLLANALYGKFIQSVEARGFVDKAGVLHPESGYRAGGLFNPALASWITALARVRIYQLECEFDSLDTATDGVKTTKPVVENPALGGVTIKSVYDYLIIRNKCCLAFDMETHKLVEKASTVHGFMESPATLFKLLVTKENKYEVQRMTQIREALRRGLIPNIMRREKRTVNVPDLLNIPSEVIRANGY